ncbi:MAG: sugar ABC transporter substrate-binding protein [Clostridiaceae bacterium]|nr:sugar ABC transporter substrate-binding protein [Clostridiaceae bacterium]
MKTIRKILVLVIAFASLMSILSLGACAKKDSGKTKVGVSMPTQSLQRWNQDGAYLKEKLEAAGYEVELQFANNEINQQVSQIENMITNKCDVLIIAAVDGDSLVNVLADAKKEEIEVIAYDRLIMKSDAVSYYATFDNYMVGTIQGEFIEKTLDLENAAGPFNMEVFAGSPDDNNARFFYQGAYDVLSPYIDSGKLVVVSGQKDFETCAITSWKTETAQSRMDDLLTANYATGTKLDVVLSPNDSIAIGITNALENSGDFTPGTNWPIITGQDCDIPNMKNIIAGKQSMSIFKDTRTLADQTVKMVNSIVKGEKVDVNDTETYDNGITVVPTYLCTPVFGDINNYKELLIDSGYYTEDQLK